MEGSNNNDNAAQHPATTNQYDRAGDVESDNRETARPTSASAPTFPLAAGASSSLPEIGHTRGDDFQQSSGCLQSRRNLLLLCLVSLAVIGLVVGLAVGLSNDGGDNDDAAPESPASVAPGVGVTTPCLTCSWVQIGSDLQGPTPGDLFGERVSIAKGGTRIAISAPNYASDLDHAGLVRVYDLDDDGNWHRVGQDMHGPDPFDRIRGTLSSDGTRLAIAAPDGGDGNTGQVRVYQLESGQWSPVGEAIYGEGAGDLFGSSVALSDSGMVLAVGAMRNDGVAGNSSGHVRVYRDGGDVWDQIGSDLDGEAGDDFSGKSVSLSSDGEVVAVGAWRNNGTDTSSGHVRLFQFDAGNWTQLGQDIDGEGKHHEAYVTSLSSDGKTVAVNGDWGQGRTARVFRLDEDDNEWDQLGNSIEGDNLWNDEGGISISANGQRVAVSTSHHHSTDSPDLGITRVYDKVGVSWRQVGSDIVGKRSGQNFGRIALSADGSRMAVGGPAHANDRKGVVRLFQLQS